MPFSNSAQPYRAFGFLLVENFSMMSVTAAIEPLRSANRLLDREEYRWHFVSPDGLPIAASNGVGFPTSPAQPTLSRLDILIVCSGYRVDVRKERKYISILRQAVRRKLTIGAFGTGTYLLARAGLLDGYTCTIHWENKAAFDEEFANLRSTGTVYEIDRDRITCAGGLTVMDLILHIIGQSDGEDLARAVANQFNYEHIRGAANRQCGGRLTRPASLPHLVRHVIEVMTEHVENPLSIEDIARKVNSTARRVERLFMKYLGVSPLKYYLSLRIDRARELLLYSDMSVFDVSVATGFASSSHMTSWFQKILHQTPTKIRNG